METCAGWGAVGGQAGAWLWVSWGGDRVRVRVSWGGNGSVGNLGKRLGWESGWGVQLGCGIGAVLWGAKPAVEPRRAVYSGGLFITEG